MFAFNIGLNLKVQLFDNESDGSFLALIDAWVTAQPSPTIGENKRNLIFTIKY